MTKVHDPTDVERKQHERTHTDATEADEHRRAPTSPHSAKARPSTGATKEGQSNGKEVSGASRSSGGDRESDQNGQVRSCNWLRSAWWHVRVWWRLYGGVVAVLMFVLVVIVVGVVTALCAGKQAAKEWGDLIKNYATTGAVIAGGVWALCRYYEDRYRWPRLVGSQRAEFVPVDKEHLLVRVWVTLENKGNSLACLDNALVTVRKILPLTGVEKDSEKSALLLQRHDGRWLWPHTAVLELSKKGDFEVEVEPGEQDTVAFDLLLSRECELVEICTDLQNNVKKDMGWKSITLHRVTTDPTRVATANGRKGDENE